jgi:hypothetical protein
MEATRFPRGSALADSLDPPDISLDPPYIVPAAYAHLGYLQPAGYH